MSEAEFGRFRNQSNEPDNKGFFIERKWEIITGIGLVGMLVSASSEIFLGVPESVGDTAISGVVFAIGVLGLALDRIASPNNNA